MAQGQFTKEEAKATREAVDEVMRAMPKAKVVNFLGHFNDIFLFIDAAEKVAPTEAEFLANVTKASEPKKKG